MGVCNRLHNGRCGWGGQRAPAVESSRLAVRRHDGGLRRLFVFFMADPPQRVPELGAPRPGRCSGAGANQGVEVGVALVASEFRFSLEKAEVFNNLAVVGKARSTRGAIDNVINDVDLLRKVRMSFAR